MDNENSTKVFIIPSEAWYKDVIKGKSYIYIGLYHESSGVEGELNIVWEDLGIQFRAFHDSWEVLGRMPELIELMGRIGAKKMKPTIWQFARMLEDIGFKDITERTWEDDDIRRMDTIQ